MLPHFVIIGAQKSASSFLHDCLGDHPDIFLPDGEVPFFESPDYEKSSLQTFEELFKGRVEKCIGIRRPSYIGKPEVPARILNHLPDAKLIAVLRNPVDRAIAAYFHNINYGFIPPKNIERGMRELISNPSFAKKYQRSPEIIEFGYYYKYLKAYTSYIENGQLLVLLHDDIQATPKKCIQQAYSFLGVNPSFIPPSLESRPQKVIYNIHRLRLLSLRNHFMYEYNAERTRLYPKKMTRREWKASDWITKLDRKVLSKIFPNNKPRISPSLRRMLYDLYADDINALAHLFNLDLTPWNPKD